ncbi:UPF0118 inner membrane protein YdiK [Serratia symbiotica]|nr:UPF0118 inner membrane protein YdiK [Serratia symbiotica]
MIKLKQLNNVPKIIFNILFIVIMIIANFWVIQPFILGFTWAVIVVIATWPLLIKLQNILWNNRLLAVTSMMLLLILLFILPISLMIYSLINNSSSLISGIITLKKLHFSNLEWLQSLPIIGEKIYNSYYILVNTNGSDLLIKIQPYFGKTATWCITQIIHIGHLFLHCILMLLFSTILYIHGEKLALGIRNLAIRLGIKNSDNTILLSGQAIRAVALGVIVTALIQSILSGIGLAISGIPAATWLTILIFILCVAQLGPLLILIPAIIWLYWNGDNTCAIILIIWSSIVTILDNIIRPILIRMGADLPMILILSGVIGGLLAFGLIGVFIGPVILAISFRLLTAWIYKNT